MTEATHHARRHDLAYACFLPSGLVAVISSASSILGLDSAAAGGVGLLLLVPLSILALIAVPIGVYLSAVHWKDTALLVLAAASVVMLIQLFAEIGSVRFRNALWAIYGIIVFIIEAHWFLFRRRLTHTS